MRDKIRFFSVIDLHPSLFFIHPSMYYNGVSHSLWICQRRCQHDPHVYDQQWDWDYHTIANLIEWSHPHLCSNGLISRKNGSNGHF